MQLTRDVRVPGTIALAVALGLGVAACTSDNDPPTPDATEIPGSAEPTFVGAIADLTTVDCAPVDGVWSGTGEVVNDADEPRRYNVKFAVINPDTSDVLGEKSFKVKVKPGKSKAIDVPSFHEGNTKNGECVQRVTLDVED